MNEDKRDKRGREGEPGAVQLGNEKRRVTQICGGMVQQELKYLSSKWKNKKETTQQKKWGEGKTLPSALAFPLLPLATRYVRNAPEHYVAHGMPSVFRILLR